MTSKTFKPKEPPYTEWVFSFSDIERAYKAGVPAALYDAVCYLREVQGPHGETLVPDWMWDGILAAVEKQIDQPDATGPGRTGNKTAKYKANMVNWRRYKAVVDAKSEGCTWDLAYETAHEILKGTVAQGEPETMKNSYQKVSKALDDPSQRDRFYMTRFFSGAKVAK